MAPGQICKVIIGAGPSGSIAGALLRNKGYHVTIREHQRFPRFSIGESLLPQCMEFIQQAVMMETGVHGGFEYKDGVSFVYRNRQTEFSFEDKFTAGIGTAFQVQRDGFDNLLASEAVRKSIDIQWQMEVIAVDFTGDKSKLKTRDEAG